MNRGHKVIPLNRREIEPKYIELKKQWHVLSVGVWRLRWKEIQPS